MRHDLGAARDSSGVVHLFQFYDDGSYLPGTSLGLNGGCMTQQEPCVIVDREMTPVTCLWCIAHEEDY